MTIEKYFYSDHREAWNKQQSILEQLRQERQARLEALPKDKQHKIKEKESTEAHKRLEKLVEELLPITDDSSGSINVPRYSLFRKLAEKSVSLAEAICANLLVDVKDMEGCIYFVFSEMCVQGKEKEIMKELEEAADEVHLRISADTGSCTPIDLDDLIQLEYWFDFYTRNDI